MAVRCRLLALAAVSLAAAAVFAVPAGADGDPASDVLYAQDVFVPYAKPSQDAVAKAGASVAKANGSGYRIKVAVISSQFDLGTATALMNKPQKYADFLGAEIKFFYHGHLLVVMPGGFGVNFGGHGTSLAQTLLKTLHAPGRKPDDLAAYRHRTIRLCVAARDPAGNVSPPGCVPVRLP